jgi:ADP-ribose pyrophosphatase
MSNPKTGPRPLGLPDITLEPLEDLSPADSAGFLRLVRRRFRAHYPDGTVSDPFVYDEVDRRALDATVIAAHYADSAGVRQVYLRSALRPPTCFRDPARSPVELQERFGGLWELPAGLVEPTEQTPEGLVASAARELDEELGFQLPPTALTPRGSRGGW